MSPLNYSHSSIDPNLPTINLTNHLSNEKLNVDFTVNTFLGCYVKLDLYNDDNKKFETLESDTFYRSTYFEVSVPDQTKRIHVYVGANFVDCWRAPFEGKRGLQVKVIQKFMHDFHMYTCQKVKLISAAFKNTCNF